MFQRHKRENIIQIHLIVSALFFFELYKLTILEHLPPKSTMFLSLFHVISTSLHKLPKFNLISWCRSFVETHTQFPQSFRRIAGKWVSTKSPHQENRRNFRILCSASVANSISSWEDYTQTMEYLIYLDSWALFFKEDHVI